MKLEGKQLLWLMLLLAVPVTYSGFAMADDAWDKEINKATKRFKLVLDGAAVLDNETGLVWEKSPDTTTRDWYDAAYYAYNKNVGGRGGWRLPTVEELRTLVDPTRSNPALPSGHPFTNVQSGYYWSSTPNVASTSNAWFVGFSNGVVYGGGKILNGCVWCVRGGHGYDAP